MGSGIIGRLAPAIHRDAIGTVEFPFTMPEHIELIKACKLSCSLVLLGPSGFKHLPYWILIATCQQRLQTKIAEMLLWLTRGGQNCQ